METQRTSGSSDAGVLVKFGSAIQTQIQKLQFYRQRWIAFMAHIWPESGIVWWLLDLQRDWWKQIVAAGLFLLLFSMVSFTPSQAVIWTVSMFLHEAGHALVFKANGIKFVLRFIFPLGAVAAPSSKAENARSDELPWANLGALLLAGPIVTLTLVAIGRLVILYGSDELSQIGHDLVYINGLLLVLNVVPVWTLDAGQLFKLVYSSMTEQYDRWLSWLLIVLTMVLIASTLFKSDGFELGYSLGQLINNFHSIAFGVVFVVGNWIQQKGDNPNHAKSTQRMTTIQIVGVLSAYFSVVAAGLMLM